jgi:hypothetical protein
VETAAGKKRGQPRINPQCRTGTGERCAQENNSDRGSVLYWRVAIALAAIVLGRTFPGAPDGGRSLTFKGFVMLPADGRILTVLDYLTIDGRRLFVTNTSSGTVYKLAVADPFHDIQAFPLEPAAHGVVGIRPWLRHAQQSEYGGHLRSIAHAPFSGTTNASLEPARALWVTQIATHLSESERRLKDMIPSAG